jgi:hypothetical protein
MIQLAPLCSKPDAVWIQDINGDGIPDLIARFSDEILVWYGLGNFEFEKFLST